MNDKRGIVFLLKYLFDNTDMDHTVNSVQLRKILQENGYAADRRTIRKDVELLAASGFDIMVNERNGVPTEYYYGTRDWDRNEVRILVDAVSSAQFITLDKTQKLIKKLAVLAGRQFEAELTPQVYVSENVKAQNDKLLYIIERITQGIQQKKKIAFKMYNYNTNKRQVLRHGGEIYVISPYNTIWMDDRYYVVGWSDKRQDIVSMRVDRMGLPDVLEEDAVPPPKKYRVQDYTDTITRMYPGSRTEVMLRCRKDMIDYVIDKFGTKVRLSNVTDDTFDATVTVAVSGTFLAWVFQCTGSVTIVSPEPVREMYAEMLRTSVENMSTCMFEDSEERVWKL